jgi:membrane fusion protein, multidrug efflux system
MKQFLIFSILGAVLLALVLAKIFANTQKDTATVLQPGQQKVQAECIVAEYSPGEFSYSAVGKIRANERVEIASEIPGRLVSIHFREGSRVNRGDLLFHIDDSEWVAELSRLQAQLELARNTEDRNRPLLDSGGISQQLFDEMVSQRKILEAEEELLQVKIEKANIRAPFDGFAGIRNVSEGAMITPGTVLTVLEDLERLKLEFTVPEYYAAAIRKGDLIRFRTDGIPGYQEAVIDAFDPSVSLTTGNFRVLALVKRPDPFLKAGVAVTVTLQSESPSEVLFVPTQALVPVAGGYHLFMLENGKASNRKVTTGIRSATRVEIVEGIAAGDTILLTGFMRLRNGSPVKIVKVW